MVLVGTAAGLSWFVAPFMAKSASLAATALFALAFWFVLQRGRALALPAPALAPPAMLALLALSVVLAVGPLHGFANSADEYGYHFLADTLLRGRLWNEPPPLPEASTPLYTVVKDGKWVSMYAPGWPALLAGWSLLGLPRVLLSPLLSAAAAWLTWQALAGLAPRPIALLALLCGIATPFWLFTAASFFNHALATLCVAAVLALSVGDEVRPSRSAKLGIGLAFAVMLTTRYEVFALVGLLFGADLLLRRRLRPADLPFYVLGALPVILAFLAYNHAITGSAFTTVQRWSGLGGSEIGFYAVGTDGEHSPLRALRFSAVRAGTLASFGGPFLACAAAFFLLLKLLARRLRWYDLLWPSGILFFALFPDSGGFQYGPRYWHFALPGMMATIATGVPILLQHRAWSSALAAGLVLQLCYAAGVTVGYGVFLDRQVRLREQPFTLAESLAGAVILVWQPGAWYRMSPLQAERFPDSAADYVRNAPGLTGRNLYLGATAALAGPICRRYRDRPLLSYELNPNDGKARLEPLDCARFAAAS